MVRYFKEATKQYSDFNYFDFTQIKQINYALNRCNCMYGFLKEIKYTQLPSLNWIQMHEMENSNANANVNAECQIPKMIVNYLAKNGFP